jgi:hypothetical protein
MIKRTERLFRALRRDGRWFALAVLALLVLLAWFGLAAPYLNRYQMVDLRLENLQRQRAALVGFVQQAPQLEARLRAVPPDAALRLPVAERNLASADLQSRLDSFIRPSPDQPCAIRSRQDVSGQRSQEDGTIVVRLEMECDYRAFFTFLHTAEAARPLIFIEGLLLSRRRYSHGATDPGSGIQLVAQVELMAYLDGRRP